ncbi:MAG: response regulator [Aphanothece sp. CMT-3BRIN-NPC111]|jgi:signal transduction histidine kinase|nr:response regulator [Aphanothece sp. CMT-3BRIN-NPC111]
MSNTKLLVVEDEEIVAFDIESTLNTLGYDVIAVVPSGEEAIQEAATSKPDLVLMDIRLKGSMDGIQASESIIKHFNIPVVYLTAHADAATLERAKITTPFGYLVKPFEESALHTTIEIALSRHQAEETMRQALEKEKELNELKSQFLSFASHEFRMPLTTIRLSTDILEALCRKFLDAKTTKHFNRIYKSIAEMVQIINDILVLEKAEAGKLEFEPTQLDIGEFCGELIEPFQFNAGEQYLITFNSPNNLNACIDETLMRYILSNLLSNAIKYSPHGGNINVELNCEDETVILRIQDWGIGIPQENQAQLFEPFYRASNVRRIQGTGVGLSVVKQCVDLHGGQIAVESELGVGTTFTVMLPVNPKQ